MSGVLEKYLIRSILAPLYGESRELNYLMHPDNRLAQFLIADALLDQYRQIITDPRAPIDSAGYSSSLNQAVQDNIKEELTEIPDHVKCDKRYGLHVSGPNPPNFPRFLRLLFPLNEQKGRYTTNRPQNGVH